MATKRTTKPIKIRIDNLRGSYSGEIADGLVRDLPDGYGTATLDDGFTLKGRFKHGNFVQGTAESSNIFLKGDFDNLTWLGGEDGYIKFSNGDTLEGGIDPISKELIIRQLTATQEPFGDTVKLYHQKTADGKFYLVGELGMRCEGKIFGTFRELSQNTRVPTYFGVPKMNYICTNGECIINFSRSNGLFSQIGGRIRTDLNNTTTINGEFNFRNESLQTFLTIRGQFGFERDLQQDKQFDFSEKFVTLHFQNSPKFHTTLTLQDAPNTIIYETPNGKFVGQKKFIASENQPPQSDNSQSNDAQQVVYVGTMTSRDRCIELNGTFDSTLRFKCGKIRYTKDDEIINLTSEQISIQVKKPQTTCYSSTNSIGEYQNSIIHQKGTMAVEFSLTSDFDNIVKSCSFAYQPILTQGEIQHTLPDGSYFDGKLTSSDPKTHKHNNAYVGEFIKTDNDGNLEFRKMGIFDKNYVLKSGSIHQKNINDSNKDFDGTKDASGYNGTLTDPRDGSYESGLFDRELNFLSGKFKKIYDNSAIFEGETTDLITANGILFRNGDFIQKGDFIIDWGCPENPTFERGKLLVRFDDKEQTFCEGIFDCDGLGLTTKDDKPLFADATYLLNFKNSSHPNGMPLITRDITDAYTQFLMLTRYQDLVNCKHPKVADAAKSAEQTSTTSQANTTPQPTVEPQLQTEITATENNNNTATNSDENKSATAHYDDIVQIAGQTIHTQDASTQPFDQNLASNVMSKLINPNKENSQIK